MGNEDGGLVDLDYIDGWMNEWKVENGTLDSLFNPNV
jgi:hypothetical protein